MLTIMPLSVQKLRFAGYIFCGGGSDFLFVEGFTACLYDCPQFRSAFYQADKNLDCISKNIQDTVLNIAPITSQAFN